MPVPGPPEALWATALLAWAIESAVLGEALRWVGARWVPLWRVGEPIERFLLDFFLGGAVLYLVAALPVGAFGRPVVYGLPVVAAAGLVALVLARRRTDVVAAARATVRRLWAPAPLLAIGAALALYAVELSAAIGAGTGNTFDSSLLTTYTALLLQHGRLPLSFQPYGSPMILYPQGTTVWLGAAQLDFGLPPARTALLVTPLFLALVPLAGYVFGRRWFSSDRAGAAVALALAFLGPSTRSLVGGSNDLAFAFPLVLLLLARSGIWARADPPGWGDAVGFGLLLGYSAAINPVGAEWTFFALLGFGVLGGPTAVGRARRSLARWGAALGAALGPVVPSLYVLALGHASPGFVPGATGPVGASRTGISVSQLVGSLDPFLFRPGDVALSPIAAVRLELALLLVLGLGLLLLGSRRLSPDPLGGSSLEPFARWALAAGGAIGAELLVLTAAGAGWPIARSLAELSSGPELSLWLFAIYGIVASVPLVVLFDRLGAPGPSVGRSAAAGAVPRRRTRRAVPAVTVPLVAALVILAPAVVLTPTQLPPVLTTLYSDFGRVSPGDFALLACAGAHLPVGSRVLVDPGSAAEFLPGYARGITLLYPLVPGWQWANASYALLVDELRNGTLDAAGTRALDALHVDYVAITGNNTVLWPPFSPGPFVRDPGGYPELFHSADAYLFAVAGAPTFSCG